MISYSNRVYVFDRTRYKGVGKQIDRAADKLTGRLEEQSRRQVDG